MSPRPSLNLFEIAQQSHKEVVLRTPIGRTALMNSLQRLRETGSTLVRNEDIGMIRYSTIMGETLTSAVFLVTQPPLTNDQKNVMLTEIGSFEAITEANTPDGGGPTAPTDTNTIDTSKKKA